MCSLPAPTLTVIESPLKVTILNEASLQKAQLYQPLPLNFHLVNNSSSPIDTEVMIEESDDFYIGGEIKSFVNLMPC